MRRAGFTLLELLMVIGILGIVSTVTIPMYRSYQIRNDLNVATEQITQGLARARLLSQSAKDDSGWGFYAPNGTLFKGDSYADRDATYDETYSMPSTISFSGLEQVAYSKTNGVPSATGSITLTAIDQETRTIQIDIAEQNVSVAIGDKLTICHNPGPHEVTITINDNAWPAHEKQGDTMGACPNESSESEESSSAQSSSIASSAASSSNDDGGSCTNGFKIMNGTFTAAGQQTINFKAIASYITYGQGGPSIPVTLAYSTDGGKKWSNLFKGKAISGGETDSVTIGNGTQLILQENAYYKQNGWLLYSATHATNDSSGYTQLFTNGQQVPNIAGYKGQTGLRTTLYNKGVADSNGYVNVGTNGAVMIGELGSCLNCASADFQDAIMTMTFSGNYCQ